MSKDIDQLLVALLSDVPGISKIGGGPVPLPDPTGEMSDHLFVNLTFGSLDLSCDTTLLVHQLRDLAFDAFYRIRKGLDVRAYATICLSLFAPISDAEGVRIYRTRIGSKDLPHLTRKNLKQVVTGEESGKREVHELLKAVE